MNIKKYLHKMQFISDNEMYEYVKAAKISRDDIVKMDAQNCILVFWGC